MLTTFYDRKVNHKFYSDLSDIWQVENGYEHVWKCPEKLGSGFVNTIKLRPGLLLGISNCRITRLVDAFVEFTLSPICIAFSLDGIKSNFQYSEDGDYILAIQSGCNFVAYHPVLRDYLKYPPGISVHFLSIYIDPAAFAFIYGGKTSQVHDDFRRLIDGDLEKSFFSTFSGTPCINEAIHQILNCSYKGFSRQLYLESKTLELIAHTMEQLSVNVAPTSCVIQLRTKELKSIRRASEILVDNLVKPPSVMKLSRKVGINKDKLNHGFKQMYGSSPYEYLRIARLERARELLKSKEMNVSEVAFNVGYSHPKNFTRAFKNHFGTNPKDYLR